MKFLFIKRTLGWPRGTGHDVHNFYMMQALARLKHDIELATVEAPADEALAGLSLAGRHDLTSSEQTPLRLTWLQRRYLRYWGIDPVWLHATAGLTERTRPDVVVAAGLDVLPCLAGVDGPTRVWYAADEMARRHWSMLSLRRPATWNNLWQGAIAGLYERAYAAHIDRIWVVSNKERLAMRRLCGLAAVDVIPNGVDSEYFRPSDEQRLPHSCTFWGRLDAGPNIQAIEWFCRTVWPIVRKQVPDARFTAIGFNPVPSIRALTGKNGVTVLADVADLRPEVRCHEVVVLPFVSGGGIKNKLLEAAALGVPIVCTPMSCGGLNADGGLPIRIARTPMEWLAALQELWNDATLRTRCSVDARHWVTTQHTWESAARAALAGLRAPKTAYPTKTQRTPTDDEECRFRHEEAAS